MNTDIKVNFSKPMLILKIRETYKAPYHKNKFISIIKLNCATLAEFRKFMQGFTGNWSSGSYDVQYVFKEGSYSQNTIYSTLVRIDVRDGKVVKVWKNSPYSKKEYPLWSIIKEFRLRKKVAKKKVAKKKVAKKKVDKKKVGKKNLDNKKFVNKIFIKSICFKIMSR